MTETMSPTEYNQLIADKISEMVEASPRPRKDIADAVGLTPARMRRKLRGETVLMVNEVCAFARVFQIEPSELIAS